MIRKPVFNIAEIEAAAQPTKKEVDKRTEDKEFIAKKQANGFYTIEWTSGGEVPAVLKGFYTSSTKAEQMAKAYLLNRHATPAS